MHGEYIGLRGEGRKATALATVAGTSSSVRVIGGIPCTLHAILPGQRLKYATHLAQAGDWEGALAVAFGRGARLDPCVPSSPGLDDSTWRPDLLG